MIRVVMLWIVLFAIVFLGIGTWRHWTTNAAWSLTKYAAQASIAATVVYLILFAIVVIF